MNDKKLFKTVMWGSLAFTLASVLTVYLTYELLLNDIEAGGEITIFTHETEKEVKPIWEEVLKRVEEELGEEMALKVFAIIQCESNWNPDAINTANKNKTFDAGLWQINSTHKISNACKLDVNCSTDYAIELIKKQGLKPWACAKKLNLV